MPYEVTHIEFDPEKNSFCSPNKDRSSISKLIPIEKTSVSTEVSEKKGKPIK